MSNASKSNPITSENLRNKWWFSNPVITIVLDWTIVIRHADKRWFRADTLHLLGCCFVFGLTSGRHDIIIDTQFKDSASLRTWLFLNAMIAVGLFGSVWPKAVLLLSTTWWCVDDKTKARRVDITTHWEVSGQDGTRTCTYLCFLGVTSFSIFGYTNTSTLLKHACLTPQ